MKLQTINKLLWGFSFLFLYSCQKDLNSVNSSPQVNVYVAGYEHNGPVGSSSTHAVAKLWKNGIPVNLSDGSRSTFPASVFVQGNDVFVCGNEENNNVPMAMYWKNGIPFKLSPGIINTVALSITVVGNDVYVAGFSMTMGGSHAMYWKNGNPVYLSYSTYGYSSAYSIAVSGSDIYVAGQDDVGQAVYWKNGNPVVHSSDSRALSMVVEGNDVYLAGISFGYLPGSRSAIVWKNGVPMQLMDGSYETFAHSIAVSENDVYVAGSVLKELGLFLATYWKNDSLVRLSTRKSYGSSIAVSKNDVYVAGIEINSTENANVATYWKNGNPVYLTDGSREAAATSILIAIQ